MSVVSLYKRALIIAVAGATLSPYWVMADADKSKSATQERAASDTEKNKVLESLARINCKATLIEKESADLFEVDDATCEIGKYDIKLDGKYAILSMTKD